MKCSYPKCNKVAEVRLGMADPDAEMIPYCKECAEKVKMNTFMAITKSKPHHPRTLLNGECNKDS